MSTSRPNPNPSRQPGERDQSWRGLPRVGVPVLVACGWLFALAPDARAVPADASVVLAPGSEKFLKTGVSVTGVAWEPVGALDVEPLPSDELFVQAKPGARGEVVLLVAGVDRALVFRICVGDPARDCPKATSIELAKPSCPGLAQEDEDGEAVWRVPVNDAKCLGALLGALRHASVPPGQLRVSLSETGVFAYAERLKKALASDPATKGLTLSLMGPMLRLEGAAPREVVARALLMAWNHVPGRIAYDDATKTLPSAPGAPKLFSPFIRLDPDAALPAAPRSP